MQLEHPDYYRKKEIYNREKYIKKIIKWSIQHLAKNPEDVENNIWIMNELGKIKEKNDNEIIKEYDEIFN